MFGILKKYFELFGPYVSQIQKTDNVAIMYHTDCDGVCSCTIIKKLLKYLLDKDALIFTQKQGKIAVTSSTIKLLGKNKRNKFITVDMAVDEDPGKIKKIENFADILIIDHHIKKADLSSAKTTFIKAQDFAPGIQPSKNPASKMCFDLAKSMINDRKFTNELKYISSIGISGDMGYDFWTQKKFLTNGAKEKITKIDHIISSYLSAKGNYNTIVNILETEDIERKINKLLVKNKDISKYYLVIQEELERLILEMEHRAYFLKSDKKEVKLVFYRIKSGYNIKSILANKLSSEYFPDSTVIIEKRGGFSARNQTFKISMNDMVKSATKNIDDSSGGGHIPAAGGYVPEEKVDEFFRNVVEYIKGTF